MTTVMAFAVALLGALQETPAEPVSVRLVSSPKKGPGDLRFEGKALFPDGIVLKGTLFRLEERFTEGRLSLEPMELGNDVATVEGKRISLTLAVKDTGLYRLVVELREDLQEPDLLASIKKSPVGKWSFVQAIWGDDFVNLPGPKLREFEQQTDLAVGLTRRFVAATASEKMWKELYPNLDKELAGYLKKLDQTCLEKFYPASVVELRGTMRNLKGNAEAVLFADDGTCKGSIDYRTQKPTKTIHSQDFWVR